MNVDTSGILALEEIHKKFSYGIEVRHLKSAIGLCTCEVAICFIDFDYCIMFDLQLAMANLRWQVIYRLKVAKWLDRIGGERVFLSVGEAVDACLSTKVAGGSSC